LYIWASSAKDLSLRWCSAQPRIARLMRIRAFGALRSVPDHRTAAIAIRTAAFGIECDGAVELDDLSIYIVIGTQPFVWTRRGPIDLI
jgi:hypothetical protein